MELSIQKILIMSFLSFILGIGAASLIEGGWLFYLFFSGLALLCFVLSLFDRRLFFGGFFILICVFGFMRAEFFSENEKVNQGQIGSIELIENLRVQINTAINKYFFPPEAEFIKGLVLGQDSITDKSFKDNLNKTGTRHIVAVSGFNMAILVAVLSGILFFSGVSRRLAFLVILGFLLFYTIFVQAPPSAIRSMVMTLLTIGGGLIFTQAKALNSLLITAFLMTLLNPSILLNDIGFQLSFLAVLGIILFNEPFNNFFKKLKIPDLLVSILSLSFSAQILLIPLLIFYFGGFSIISPIINALIVPLSSLLLILGLIFAVLSIFIPLINIIVVFPMNLIASIITAAIEFFAKIPMSYLSLNFRGNIIIISLYYIIILILFLIFKKLKNINI